MKELNNNAIYEPIDVTIANAVKSLFARHLTSTEIAQQTGVTRQLIDNYRNNQSELNKMSLRNIAPLYEYELRLAKEDENTKRVLGVINEDEIEVLDQ